MALKIRRGTDAQRSGVTFDIGEIVWTTDAKQLWMGDNLTQGGIPVVGDSVIGYGLSFNSTTKRIELGTVYTDDITESPTAVKKFFTQDLAQDAAALLFTTGIHSGVTVQYDDQNGRINLTVDPDDIGITDLVLDTSPQLGGNLDLNGNSITGAGTIDIGGDITTLNLTVDGYINSTALPPGGFKSNTVVAIGSNTDPNTLWINSTESFGVFNGIADGTGNSTGISFRVSRGTLSTKTSVEPGDLLITLDAFGYDGTDYLPVGGFIVAADPDAIVSAGSIPSAAAMITLTDSGVPNFAKLDSKGVFSVPVIQTGVYVTTPSDTRPIGVKGMIIFNDSVGKFQGFDGTTWVDLS